MFGKRTNKPQTVVEAMNEAATPALKNAWLDVYQWAGNARVTVEMRETVARICELKAV